MFSFYFRIFHRAKLPRLQLVTRTAFYGLNLNNYTLGKNQKAFEVTGSTLFHKSGHFGYWYFAMDSSARSEGKVEA